MVAFASAAPQPPLQFTTTANFIENRQTQKCYRFPHETILRAAKAEWWRRRATFKNPDIDFIRETA
ncbi:hypothetical protein [Enterobacter cloacae complex sp. 2DZ2F20B]|uniref:hypothetical protein n=1 Tax=Enterobacter cloacae complex sp. 2DZ2F20B TaxID=2511993 RepID=UPI00101067D6|nr:hypothetical protein [Enterobacter cloacae complex sp. 2DZ2F20B]RYA67641.1 hypothetical protein DD592_27395 [Enterobacter cloacae complex sp. 2DZ2F20B]